MWLYDTKDSPLHLNFYPDDFLSDDFVGLPESLSTPEVKAHIKTFIKVSAAEVFFSAVEMSLASPALPTLP